MTRLLAKHAARGKRAGGTAVTPDYFDWRRAGLSDPPAGGAGPQTKSGRRQPRRGSIDIADLAELSGVSAEVLEAVADKNKDGFVSHAEAKSAGLADKFDEMLADESSAMMARTLQALKRGVFLEDDPPIREMMKPGADWSEFAPWLLARVQAGNVLGGPRMRVVWWGTLAKLGHIPRWPDEHAHILDLERLCRAWIKRQDAKGKINGRVMCVSFFSHRWKRPSLDPAESRPDSEENCKAKALAKYGENGTCPIFHPHHVFDYFFWIDYACIDQHNRREKFLGMAKLSAYIASCIEMIFFHTPSYEGRAWTRVERCISYVYVQSPLFVFIDAQYATASEALDIDDLVKNNAYFNKDEKTGGLLLELRDPLAEDAGLTDPADEPFIAQLVAIINQAKPLCPLMKMAMAASARGNRMGEARDAATIGSDEEAGEYLKYGASTFMPVDTEHWNLDCQKNAQILLRRKSLVILEDGGTSPCLGGSNNDGDAS